MMKKQRRPGKKQVSGTSTTSPERGLSDENLTGTYIASVVAGWPATAPAGTDSGWPSVQAVQWCTSKPHQAAAFS